MDESQEGQPDEDWFDQAAGPAGDTEVRLFAGLVVLKLPEFEEWAHDVLAGRSSISRSRDLGLALSHRDQETMTLVIELLAHYPGAGKTTGAIPAAHTIK